MADVVMKQAVAQALGEVFLAGGGDLITAEQMVHQFLGGFRGGVAGASFSSRSCRCLMVSNWVLTACALTIPPRPLTMV